jgi:hypothetical protein
MASLILSGSTSGSVTLSSPAVSGTTTLTLPTTSGTVALTASPTFTGQATIPTINLTGGQITFPATQSASADANTLDDYEEGTWTPTLLGSTTNPTVSSSNVSGSYTKIGNLVTIRCSANFTFTSGSGSARIGGIPFVPSGTLSIGTLENGGVTMGGTYTWGGTLAASGNNFIELRKYSNAGSGEVDITIANQATGTWIRFTIQYQV